MGCQASMLGAMKIWILISALFPAGFTQRIISPQPGTLRNLCPGEELNITCETRGSPILAWTSNEYIETGGTQLEFAIFNNVGDTRVSPVNPNIIATLISNTIEEGVQVLVSQLHIIVLDSGSSVVTCINVGAGTSTAISVNTLADPDVPEVISHQTLDASGNCILHLALNVPYNLAPEDVSHYIVKINETNFTNETKNGNTSLTLGVYPLCSCGFHNISIHTVNRCGTVGQSTLDIIVEDPLRQIPMCQDSTTVTIATTGGNEDVTALRVGLIVIGVLCVLFSTSLILICTCCGFISFRKKISDASKKHSNLEQMPMNAIPENPPYNYNEDSRLKNDDGYKYKPSSAAKESDDVDLYSLLIKLLPQVGSKWYQFGVAARIEKEVLDGFAEQYSATPDLCIIELCNYWLRNSMERPTWERVTDVLKAVGLKVDPHITKI